ncbi:clustered mitochondria protein homolog [Galendromus occidentalis]|uniref:Clustered mitochondria protein homolog n=1 Tax=Galendromus occidentalis TaxID=34638 RepID=A0AAJ6QMA3_9ACAR|nr:clustered mitochondria protein homolog [Galendromus occidentalis]
MTKKRQDKATKLPLDKDALKTGVTSNGGTDCEQNVVNGQPEAQEQKQDAEPIVANEPSTQEQNAGNQQNGEAELDADMMSDVPFNIIVELPNDKTVELCVSPQELVQETHQRLMDMQDTCHRTCFHLTFNNVTLDNFAELKSIEGLKEGSIVKFIEEPYTQRKAKTHLRHIRDMINCVSPAEIFSGQDFNSPSFLSILTGGDVIARVVDGNKSIRLDEDCTPPSFIMPGAKDVPLSGLLLDCEEQHRKALKVLTLSGWNPPPGPRKLRGDLLYLYVTTLEEKTYHLTASSKGFFVNCSTEEVFDPRKQSQLGKASQTYHSLVDLLNNLSSGFKKNFALIQKFRCSRNDLERVITPYQVYSWLAPTIEHTLDAIRAEDASSFKLGYEEQIPGQTRDWNDELQSSKELPKTDLRQRIQRERALFKVHGDFVSAATRGAMAVVDGNVLALNPGEDFRSQMFIWNNIFFSMGFDVRDHYKDFGGDAAAHVALINDLKGVQAYFSADVDGLHTLGTVVIEYRGYRVMAQSIIPGILDKEQDQSVVYGSIDGGKTIVTHEKYVELLSQAAETVRVQPHGVYDSKHEAVKLYSSIECKGIVGDDSRHYILDLSRTFPPDVNYLKQNFAELPSELKDLGFPKEQRHKLSSLRQELIEHFVDHKYVMFVKSCAMEYQNLERADKDAKQAKEISNGKESESATPAVEKGNDSVETKSPEDETKESERKSEILKKATEAVNSLRDDKFHIAFNSDAFLENIELVESPTLAKERQLIVEAADFLVNTQIPHLVKETKEHGASIMDGYMLTGAMHSKGINMRYLGLLTKLVAAEPRLSYLHCICIQEILCRAAKHIYVSYMQSAEAHMVAEAVSHFLNCLLSTKLPANFLPACVIGASKASKNRNRRAKGSQSPTSTGSATPVVHATLDWTTITPKTLFDLVKREAREYFDYELDGDCFDATYQQYDVHRYGLMRGFCLKTGIQLRQKNYHLQSSLSTGAFTDQDVASLFPVVRHMEPRASDAFRRYLDAQTRIQQGSLTDAFDLIAESLQLMNHVYGPSHPEIVQCMKFLARLSYILNEHETALLHQRRAVIMSERVNGFDSPHTILEYGSLALYLFACGQVSTTLKVLYRMRYLMLTVCGEKHPDMATLDANIGLVLFAMQQYDLALSFLEHSLRLNIQFHGEKSLKTALSYHLVAEAQSCLGDFRSGLKNEKETYAIYRAILGDNQDNTKESAEFLRHLTQQAVQLQKQINKLSDSANMPKNANKVIPPINVAPIPMGRVLDWLNKINGIIYFRISHADIEALRVEFTKRTPENEEQPIEGSIIEEIAKSNKNADPKHESNDIMREPVVSS